MPANGSSAARLTLPGFWREINFVSANKPIEQFNALPASERAQVAKFVVEYDDSWVSESFKRGRADAEAGHFVDMETVLSGAPPSGHWR